MMFKKLAIGLAIVLIASCKHEHKPQSSTNESFRKDEFVVVATVNSGDSYTQSKVVRVLTVDSKLKADTISSNPAPLQNILRTNFVGVSNGLIVGK